MYSGKVLENEGLMENVVRGVGDMAPAERSEPGRKVVERAN